MSELIDYYPPRSDRGTIKIPSNPTEREAYAIGLKALKGLSGKELEALTGIPSRKLWLYSVGSNGFQKPRPGPERLKVLASLCGDLSEVLWRAREVLLEAAEEAPPLHPTKGSPPRKRPRSVSLPELTAPWLKRERPPASG